MSRQAAKIELSTEEAEELNRWVKSGKTEQRKVERAKIVLRSAEGKMTHQIARELGTRPSTVSKWRKRFAQQRLAGLEDEQRSGRRVKNDENVERRILDQLMSNSYAKRSITSFALTMRRRLPLNGAGAKSNNSLSEIISLISANNH